MDNATLLDGFIVEQKLSSNKTTNKTLIGLLKLAEINNILILPNVLEYLARSPQTVNAVINFYASTGAEVFNDSFFNSEKIKNSSPTEEDYINQIKHYFIRYNLNMIDTSVFKDYKKPKKFGNREFKILELKSPEEFDLYVKNIVTSPIVFGKAQINILEVSENLKDIVKANVKDIKVKENIIAIGNIYPEIYKECDILRTVNDALRYINAVNRFGNKEYRISTSNKKFIFRLLNKILTKDFQQGYTELLQHRSEWIAIGQALHPGDKKFKNLTKLQKAFSDLRENVTFRTYNFWVEEFKRTNITKLIDHLALRPGILLRNLDFVIRHSTTEQINQLCEVLLNADLNPKLMIQVLSLLTYRSKNKTDERVVKLKNKTITIPGIKKLKHSKKVLKALKQKIKESFEGKKLFDAKSVQIDENLKKYMVPYEMRDFSVFNSKTFTPGTRISLDKHKFLRIFMSWSAKNKKAADIDLDLSGMFIKDDKIEKYISWQNLSSDYALHSGDFTSCREPKDGIVTAEFIDIDIEKAGKVVDFAIFNEICYSGVDFSKCDVNVGAIIIDKRTQSKDKTINLNQALFTMRINNENSSHTSFAFDFETNEIVIIDQANQSETASVISAQAGALLMFKQKYLDNISNMNMHKYLTLYCEANNIEIKDDAELLLSYNDSENAYNIANHLVDIVNLMN